MLSYSNSTPRWHRVIAMLPVVVAITGAQPIAQGAPATLVATDEVRLMEFSDQVTLVGRTEAWIQSKIVSEVTGRVNAVAAKEGTYVSAGDPLLQIDTDKLRLLLASKAAEAKQADFQVTLAQANLDRTKELYKRELVRKTTLDSAEAWLGVASERFNQLAAERANLQLDLDRSTITAPFTGYTGRKLVDVGEWVQPGQPVFEMVDLSKVKITVDLPERYFGRLAIGSPAQILASGTDSTGLQGVVSGIAPDASSETHTFPVIVEVANGKGRLGGGMLVKATLSLNDKFASLAVAKDAIVRKNTGTIVYTVVDGKAQPVPVAISSTVGEWVAVTADGLSKGMPVVVRGNERIYPGSPVRVQVAPTMEVGSIEPKPVPSAN
jgi:RND family efflux transporter MFP subunit